MEAKEAFKEFKEDVRFIVCRNEDCINSCYDDNVIVVTPELLKKLGGIPRDCIALVLRGSGEG